MTKFLTLFLIIFFLLLGCVKEHDKAIAFITVTSQPGFPQPNVFVNFYVASKSIRKGSIDTTLKTDKYGNCEFYLLHECFLDVLAIQRPEDSTKQAKAGSISIRMIPGQTISRTIVLH